VFSVELSDNLDTNTGSQTDIDGRIDERDMTSKKGAVLYFEKNVSEYTQLQWLVI
jgi:hypothetical protein